MLSLQVEASSYVSYDILLMHILIENQLKDKEDNNILRASYKNKLQYQTIVHFLDENLL
jgi:hypothetical protein